MSRALLDINVLLAIIDRTNSSYEAAHAWLQVNRQSGWATCAITQNGFVRVISSPSYDHPITIAQAIAVLREATLQDTHEWWPCDISLLDPSAIDSARLQGHKQITDAYFLALAVAHDGCFVTFDRSVPRSAVHGAEPRHLLVLGASA